MRGFLRDDGRKGIRNIVAAAYLVECAHHVGKEIVARFPGQDIHLIGFPGCFPNAYAQKVMERLCTHPNVGAVLLLSLGCESFNKPVLAEAVRGSGRPVKTLTIQDTGGTRSTVAAGRDWVAAQLAALAGQFSVPMRLEELVVGTICGGSDGTSGLTGNPARHPVLLTALRQGSKPARCVTSWKAPSRAVQDGRSAQIKTGEKRCPPTS